MLMKILRRLTEGGAYSNKFVAEELGVDESLVEQIILQLQQLKYIEKDSMNNSSSSCGGGCGGCSTNSSCCCSSNNVEISLWKITEKGKKALGR